MLHVNDMQLIVIHQKTCLPFAFKYVLELGFVTSWSEGEMHKSGAKKRYNRGLGFKAIGKVKFYLPKYISKMGYPRWNQMLTRLSFNATRKDKAIKQR
jgi:hypothetical protein